MSYFFIAGDRVAYRPHPGAQAEQGIVVRETDRGVFVRYGNDPNAKLTPRENLERLS
jgi:hypothetical protein